MDEGFYINESINHMLVYLSGVCHGSTKHEELEQCKNQMPTRVEWEAYSPSMCVMNPGYAFQPATMKAAGADQLFIVPLMQFLQGTYPWEAGKKQFPRAESKPSKMLMFVMVRTSYPAGKDKREHDNAVYATLEYAESARCFDTARAREARKEEAPQARAPREAGKGRVTTGRR